MNNPPTNPYFDFTPFLPTTHNVPEEADRMRSFLVDNFANMSDVINDKTIGTFTQSTEAFNGQKFSYDTTSKIRNGYQTIVRVKQYPNTGVLVLPMPMDVNPQFIISDAFGSASRPVTVRGAGNGSYFTFLSMGDPRVSFTISDMIITITTTVDLSAYNGFITILYIRDGT